MVLQAVQLCYSRGGMDVFVEGGEDYSGHVGGGIAGTIILLFKVEQLCCCMWCECIDSSCLGSGVAGSILASFQGCLCCCQWCDCSGQSGSCVTAGIVTASKWVGCIVVNSAVVLFQESWLCCCKQDSCIGQGVLVVLLQAEQLLFQVGHCVVVGGMAVSFKVWWYVFQVLCFLSHLYKL